MSKRILLIGENALDVTVIGPVHRLSPEAPVPVQLLVKSETNPGMAGNVKANLESLWPGIKVDFVHQKKGIFKIRHIDEISGQQLLRVDDGDDSSEEGGVKAVMTKIQSAIDANPEGYCACVISDYNKGFLEEGAISAIGELMLKLNVPVYLDTKKIFGGYLTNVAVLKVNAKEYAAQSVSEWAPWGWGPQLIVTRGKDGAHLHGDKGAVVYASPAKAKGIACVSGAGDTVLAALVVKHLETNDLKAAIDYAMRAASVAVSKPGIVAVKWQEVDEVA